MNAEFAQLIDLVCHGNGFLKQGKSLRALAANPVFAANEDIRFVEADRNGAETLIAVSPAAWLQWLRTRNCKGMRLARGGRGFPVPERIASAFAGGSDGAIETLTEDGMSQFWLSRWDEAESAGGTRYQPVFACLATEKTQSLMGPSLDEALSFLIETLEMIQAFAAKHERDNFARIFKDALDLARSAARARDTFGFWSSGLLPPRAQKTLDAAQAAYVFGGMGSWNDIGFEREEDHREYERISSQLFEAVNGAIAAAVNHNP